MGPAKISRMNANTELLESPSLQSSSLLSIRPGTARTDGSHTTCGRLEPSKSLVFTEFWTVGRFVDRVVSMCFALTLCLPLTFGSWPSRLTVNGSYGHLTAATPKLTSFFGVPLVFQCSSFPTFQCSNSANSNLFKPIQT